MGPMQNARVPVERLTDDEQARVRALVSEHGARQAAILLGLRRDLTVLKASVGEAVHALTASTIRARLEARAAA